MRTSDSKKYEEADDAAWEACKGAMIGAGKWGLGTAILGGLAYLRSPVYRSTTVQFKVYIQSSGMVLGAMLNAESRLREYEAQVRMQRRLMRDKARWDQYEEELAARRNEKS
uniref:HIG1 domain-containing protein n=1 Tax=Bionectria ochroleuca TaxID=29856 RepID=A0A8H7TQC8_BIOOC